MRATATEALASFRRRRDSIVILLSRILACLLVLASIPAAGAAGAEAGATESLSDRLGPEIDSAERSHYGLFPDLPGFGTGRFDSSKGAYRLIYKEVGDGGARQRGRTVSLEAFRQTAWHVAFVEEQEATAGGDGVPPSLSEPDLLRRLALRYASRKRYDLASAIAADLRDVHAAEPAGTWAMDAIPRLEALAGPRRALIWPGALLDQRGRTDLIVFSGYYGLWLGIAIPVALESEDAQAYAAGLLAAPAASVLLAVNATRNASISKGEATLISLGAHLGTWQGLGWAGRSDTDGNQVVAIGVATGLAGIALAIPLSKAVHFSEGHAQVTNSAMYWGGWFGLVESVLTGRDQKSDDGALVDMLVGSDVGVLAGAFAARGVRLSSSRMRLINLSGVLGIAFGGGIVLLTEADDDVAAMAMLGAGSAAGLLLGTHWTRAHDQGKDLAAGGRSPAIAPVLALRPGGRDRAPIPTAGFRVSF